MSKFKTYAVSILIPLILGGFVGYLTMGSMEKYNSLQMPALSPPEILFPIVWGILYTLMGISYAILKTNGQTTPEINFIYYFQLFVNLLWPIAFFVLEWRLFAFFWLLLLIALVIIMAVKFYQKNKLAGILQIPYILWTLFAAYLNLAVFLLNG